MGKQLLLRTQKNEILQIITKLELNPLDFEFHDIKSRSISNCLVSKLVHKSSSGFYFIFDFDFEYAEKRRLEYFPTSDGKQKSDSTYEWLKIINEVTTWLRTVKREITAPDLWASIVNEKRLFDLASTPNLGNELFNPAQQKYLSEQLSAIKQYVLEIKEITTEHRHFVEDRFNYMDVTLSTMGIQNWIQTVIGVSFTMIWGLALAPEQAKELVSYFGSAISYVLKEQRLLP